MQGKAHEQRVAFLQEMRAWSVSEGPGWLLLVCVSRASESPTPKTKQSMLLFP